MHYRFILVFLATILGMHSPLLAQEANHPQNTLPNEQYTLISKYDGFKDMVNPSGLTGNSPPTSQINQHPEREQKQPSTDTHNINPTNEKQKSCMVVPSKTADTCNTEILQKLQKISDGCFEEINWLVRYVGFGILIAIFYMCTHLGRPKFAIDNKCLVVFASLTTIFSLFLNYVGCTYQFWTSERLLNQEAIRNIDIFEMGITSKCFWYTINFTILISIIAFLALAYKYFFNERRNTLKS